LQPLLNVRKGQGSARQKSAGAGYVHLPMIFPIIFSGKTIDPKLDVSR